MIHFISYKLRKKQICVLENIIFLLPWKCFISFVSRKIFNSVTFLFELFWLRHSSNYYYNLHVFLKLKSCIFCVEPEYLRSETIQIINWKTVKHFFPVATQLFQCPGNITDNVVMTPWRCLGQLYFTTELNIICESRIDL